MMRKSNQTKHFLYVYGTLRTGQSNNHYLNGQKFVQEAITAPNYLLYDNGFYPCMIESENGRAIKGEIWEVTEETMNRLDQLEGVPTLYQRRTIKIPNFPNEVIGYIYQKEINRYKECGVEWK
jgi:gamma-glutamylcyclotransferase (GGCT)/AIG2-like uncharacterized protein YtfP